MARLEDCYNYFHLREEAKRRLPKWVFEFIDRGAEDEIAIKHNRLALDRIKLRNRAMVDISNRKLGTTLFGKEVSLPVAIAPTGSAGLCYYNGEVELAKAAKAKNVPFVMGTASFTPMEKIAEVGGNLWFQLYLWERRELSHDLLRRASAVGYDVLLVTADFGLRANREYNRRNGFSNPFKPTYPAVRDIMLKPGWFAKVALPYLMNGGIPKQANNPPESKHLPQLAMRAETVTWDDFARLRDVWPGKILIKGIVRADDAVKAMANGADGVVVSNHGGRNLDSTVASIDALPEIVREIGNKGTVLLDSGVRRGSDMVKAFALGAHGVLAGRFPLWGVASGGAAGGERALEILRSEYENHLAFVGARSIDELSPDVLASDASLSGHLPPGRSLNN